MNKCDIEEVKHMALQKFLELAEKPELWKYDPGRAFSLDKWLVWYNYTRHFYDPVSTSVILDTELLVRVTKPSSEYDGGPNSKVGKEIHDYYENPYVVAAKKIADFIEARSHQERCERIKRDTEASCRRIKEALQPKAERRGSWRYFWR